MRIHRFIFTDSPRHRLARHILLWVVFAAWFTIQSYYPVGVPTMFSWHFAKSAMLSTALYMPFCMLSAYCLIYYLYPRFLAKRKYFLFLVQLLVLSLAGLTINYYASLLFGLYSTNGMTSSGWQFHLGFHNTGIGIISGILILGLQLGRSAWLQQQANLRLAGLKARTERQLLKTRIDPDFLFSALDTIRIRIDHQSGDAPAAILDLSEQLSEILYPREEDAHDDQ